MKRLIYLDNNATTAPLPEVTDAMLPFLGESYANPSSVHPFGQRARHHIELSRQHVAALIEANPREIVFTSGGTESINMAIRGCLAEPAGGRHVITSSVEHSATRSVVGRLDNEGFEIDVVGVDGDGRLDVDELEARLRSDTALVTIIHANNETGVLFDIAPIAAICETRGVPLHVDAVQSVGKVPIDLNRTPVTLLSLSGHKLHGPKGAGALYVRRRTRIAPLLTGGGQERSLRAGTENVAGIVGLGAAAEAALQKDAGEDDRVRALRDRLETGVLDAVPDARVNGRGAERLANTANIGFPGIDADALLILLGEKGVCASAGSACSSGSIEPSHVLQAMNIDPQVVNGSIRFSLSRNTTSEEIDEVTGLLPDLLARIAATTSRHAPCE